MNSRTRTRDGRHGLAPREAARQTTYGGSDDDETTMNTTRTGLWSETLPEDQAQEAG